jgi:hypothetical protein
MKVINAQHFYVALVIERERIVRAPPIIGWMNGKTVSEVRRYCKRKGWQIEMVTPPSSRSA